mmetsp:Transcript_6298/g.11298  ORF Transcript_6298/g.11298 Transcript_6298/m.11298 type:complete len:98 (-) Transcript_6298:107-400(-)
MLTLHTLSHFPSISSPRESKAAMQKFFSGEAHINAMKSMRRVSRYAKVHEYFTDKLPSARNAIDEWKKDGRRDYGEPKAKCGDLAPKPCWACAIFEQ